MVFFGISPITGLVKAQQLAFDRQCDRATLATVLNRHFVHQPAKDFDGLSGVSGAKIDKTTATLIWLIESERNQRVRNARKLKNRALC